MNSDNQITLKARCIVGGNARGEVLVSSQPIAFLKGIDPELGCVSDTRHDLNGKNFSGKILVFPNAVGSSVGAYVIYRLRRNHKSPKAILNQKADIITASGCAIAGIPLYDLPRNDILDLKSGMFIAIDEKKGEIRIL